MLGGQVGMGDHAHIGDGVILGGQGSVLPGKTLERSRGGLLGNACSTRKAHPQRVEYSETAPAEKKNIDKG